jgi:hypothetical protein
MAQHISHNQQWGKQGSHRQWNNQDQQEQWGQGQWNQDRQGNWGNNNQAPDFMNQMQKSTGQNQGNLFKQFQGGFRQ